MLSRIAWPNMLSFAVTALIAAVLLSPFGDLDYAWQILAGKQIIETGQFRIVDTASYTIAGQQLPDFEWLWEAVLYGIWKTTGYGGLKVLKLACAFLPLLILARQLQQRGVGWAGVLLAEIVAVVVLAPNWNLRPLCCTTIGLMLVAGWLHDHCTGRQRLTWWLPITMLIWANCHPGVITGQALLIGAIGWEFVNRLILINEPLNSASRRRLMVVGGFGLVATFISPAPIERLSYVFRTRLNDPVWHVFVEMRPAYQFITHPPFTMILAYVLAGLCAVAVIVRFQRFRAWEIALLSCAAWLAHSAVRGLPDFLLLALALTVPVIARDLPRYFEPAINKWREFAYCPQLQLQWKWIESGLTGVFIISSVITTRYNLHDVRSNPIAAVDWIEAHNIQGRFFASTDYGSYLVWRLGDHAKCYVDTRGFYFPPQLIADSHLLPMMEGDWRSRLERVLAAGTDYFLLETRSNLWQTIQPHVTPLYENDQTVLIPAQQIRQWCYSS